MHKSLVADLQALEAGLCVTCPVSRVRWHSVLMDFIPETPEEENQIRVNHLYVQPGADHGSNVQEFDETKFINGVNIADKCKVLIGPLSFWREGTNSLHAFLNIQAFANYYFILEGLYGNGKYNRQIKKEFAKSSILTGAIQSVIDAGLPRPFRGDNQNLESMLSKVSKYPDVAGFIHLFVVSRDEVHHYLDIQQQTATPLTDDQYECLAKFTGRVTAIVLEKEMAKITASAKS